MYGIHKLHERHENFWWGLLMIVAIVISLMLLSGTISAWTNWF